MPHALLKFDDLRALTGYERAGDVARCLRKQGIRIFEGRVGPWTTLDLVNAAGGLSSKGDSDEYDPNEVL